MGRLQHAAEFDEVVSGADGHGSSEWHADEVTFEKDTIVSVRSGSDKLLQISSFALAKFQIQCRYRCIPSWGLPRVSASAEGVVRRFE